MARTQQSKRLSASSVFLDTHIVCWLYAGQLSLLSPVAIAAIEANSLMVSPMVDLELQYLYEIKRIMHSASTILTALQVEIGLQVADDSMTSIIQQAKTIDWTRDPFDRLIVGHAMLKKTSLITRDQLIQQQFQDAIW